MYLEKINSPDDLKRLVLPELETLSDEIRTLIIEVVSKNGGHLSSSLGVVELTLALHYVFDTPVDKIIWDVGHQCYTHKIITGRREKFRTLRQDNGISGFPSRQESVYDVFNTGHASNSISIIEIRIHRSIAPRLVHFADTASIDDNVFCVISGGPCLLVQCHVFTKRFNGGD